MLINKTQDYISHRVGTHKPIHPVEISTTLRIKLEKLGLQLSELDMMLKRQCLPSFSMRKQRMREIHEKECGINLMVRQCDSLLAEIKNLRICPQMRQNIQGYFAHKLKTAVLEYRTHQQIFLKKINTYRVFDDLEEDRVETLSEALFVKRNSESEEIRKSIFYLTTLLLEMKLVIGAQHEKIDRLEFYMDIVNRDLEGIGKELVEMPRKYKGTKNKIILFLSLVVSILFLLSMVKLAKRNGKF
ncbi:hypothetical protein TCON_1587 [Astathelohania contejeani]|uniref:t-SNARE coiled-coil homology domain-containing protein n=1 Tax=Astathelohania contejeani TaxID=164912 RepID=A0ABQ7HYG2_9MICR|nr:hypothetical protein TCON_1587 [Thelohania contejeani]